MRKLIPLFACLLTMLGLGVLVVENTKAEAPRTSVSSVSGGIQGSESVRTSSVTGLDRVSQLGASSTPTTCIAYTYTLSSFDLPIVTATPGAPETTAMSVVGTSTPASLPFPFTFYGVTYTSVNILNFGNLQFTTSNDLPIVARSPSRNLVHLYCRTGVSFNCTGAVAATAPAYRTTAYPAASTNPLRGSRPTAYTRCSGSGYCTAVTMKL